MKRILHISQYYYPHIGGIESVCEDIVSILKESKNYEQIVYCFGKEKSGFVNDVSVIRCKPLIKFRSQNISLKYTKKLKKIVKDFKPDIILLHFPNPIAARSVLKLHFKGKIIIFHHLDIVKQKILKKLVKPYLSLIYKRADKIIATSKNYVVFSSELLMYLQKIDLIPLSYRKENIEIKNDDKFKINEIKIQYKCPVAIFIGRHVGYKGINYAIEAFKEITDMTFIIAGVGPLTNKLVKQANGFKNIKFIGRLDSNLYRLYINMADFFVFPSWRKNEAFGISLVEALASGKPAITFNVEGSAINLINLDGVTGIECENRNVESLKKAIIKLKNSPELRKQYGENAIKRANELFSPEIFKKNILNFFENI